MKFQFNGPFNREMLLKAVSQMFDMFIGDDSSVSGSIRLTLYQDGKPFNPWGQEGCFSVEATVDTIRVPARSGEEEVETVTVLNSLNPYEFLEGELVEASPYTEVVGKYQNSYGELEDVLSFEKYCKTNNLQVYHHKEIRWTHNLLTEENVKKSKLKRFFMKSPPVGLTLSNFQVVRVYDAVQVLEENEIPYIPYEEIDLYEMGIGEVKGLTDEQLNHLEIGYTIDVFGNRVKPVYLKRDVYEKNGLRFIDELELTKEKGNTLFNYQTGLHSYFPRSYGVESELEPYGWAGTGTFYHQTKRPLYEKFGLVKAEEIGEEDFLIHPMNSMKLRKLLKKIGKPLDDIQPDGMTKDNRLVYHHGKIPSSVIKEFQSYMDKKQKLILNKKAAYNSLDS